MKSKQFKKLKDSDGKEYYFESIFFKKELDYYCESLRNDNIPVKRMEVYEKIAEKVLVSPEAVKNWIQGNNGPSDLQMVKGIAEVLNIEYHRLLKSVMEGEMKTEMKAEGMDAGNVGNSEREIIVAIHEGLLDIILAYSESVGYRYVPDKPEVNFYTGFYEKKIMQLYRVLESHVFDLSEDCYDKLHRLIAEVEYMVIALYGIPLRWVNLVPELQGIYDYVDVSSKESLENIYVDILDEGDNDFIIRTLKQMADELEIDEFYDKLKVSFDIEDVVGRALLRAYNKVLHNDFPEYFKGKGN